MDQSSGNRDASDHWHVWILTSKLNWGPKSFKVFKAWVGHSNFLPFVKKEWDSFLIQGKKSYVIKEKFKRLKDSLKWWNVNVFGWIDLKVERDVVVLNDLELEMENTRNLISYEIQDMRKSKSESIWNSLQLKECILK